MTMRAKYYGGVCCRKMSLDDCERFQKLDGLYSEAEGFEEIDAFSNGFKLGVQLMIETFANGKSVCQDV